MGRLVSFLEKVSKYPNTASGLAKILLIVSVLFMVFASISFYTIQKTYTANVKLQDSITRVNNELLFLDSMPTYIVYDRYIITTWDTMSHIDTFRRYIEIDTFIRSTWTISGSMHLASYDTIKLNIIDRHLIEGMFFKYDSLYWKLRANRSHHRKAIS